MNFQGNRSIFWLCVLLWVGSLAFVAAGLLIMLRGAALYGGLALAVAALMAASATGLYRQRRWGAALFGLLALLGSINHMTFTLLRYADLTNAGPGRVIAALISLLVAMLIPMALILLTLHLWRQAR